MHPLLLATAEYTQFSTRGKSELTQNPDGSLKEKTGGLSTDYITQFSYGIFESLNLLAPRIQVEDPQKIWERIPNSFIF